VANVGVIPIQMKMVTTKGVFKNRVLRAMYSELGKKMRSPSFQTSMRRGTKKILEASLTSQPEYIDMVAHEGKLRKELGVVNSASAMDSLVRAWTESTTVKVKLIGLMGAGLLGVHANTIVTITAIQADYQDVFDKAYSSYIAEKGATIPWLKWLLTQGSEVLISTHKVVTLPSATISRTGTNTIMIKTKGQGWGVPIEYSGTSENNYAQRAVVQILKNGGPMDALIKREVRRIF